MKNQSNHCNTQEEISEEDKDRIYYMIKAELEIAQKKYNKDKKFYKKKVFDYDVFFAGFDSGMEYAIRIRNGEVL